ncbi:phytanoyl-CoA dioxygenase [Lophiostoma macrostomum CBS 122681]|uniref:Phytanoyl-CoA dioxygenase n=1 Tax=Lophiostoma macrostomum CBS 122681 TaxID=1314788 RepID=A0A6A6T139_9PLEO|nr:phytanoyl-CoA dioxygenase [Lophiostoma macrostomum CBS 122681]
MAITIPPPIDPSYKPSVSIAQLPATAPTEDILRIIERDGGIILTNFTTQEDLAAIDADVEAHRTKTRSTEGGALNIIPKQTLAMPGLVGKSPTMARICSENAVLEDLRTAILQDRFQVLREDAVEENVIDPLLSISITLHIGFGAPRQTLHRDDNVHGIRHGGAFDLKRVSQFGCLVAGTRTTRQNGATMFVPGSHRWDDARRPGLDGVCFAEMQPGSALIFLASCYHGGGHNSVEGEVRKMHGLFFVRGTLRTEENQFLAIPRSKVLDMNPKMLSLLGYKKPTTVLGIVENEDPASNLQAVFEHACQ